jgi:hypothetical protein
MRWSVSKGDRRSRRRQKDLVQQCESYLSGNYVEYLERRNEAVPNWAWLNLLSQGSAERIRSLASERLPVGGMGMNSAAWWQAVAFLAGEILLQQDDDHGLDELRRSVLVPLELSGLAEGQIPKRPGELVRTVLDALDQHPRSIHPR